MSAQLTLITVTSMLFVKIPWALTRVHVKLDIQEMENNVVVRTISKKYSKKDWRPFSTHTIFFSTMGSKLPSSPTAEVLVLIAKTVMPASNFSTQNWERSEPRNERLRGRGKERSQLSLQVFHFWFNWVKRNTICWTNNLPAINIFCKFTYKA